MCLLRVMSEHTVEMGQVAEWGVEAKSAPEHWAGSGVDKADAG